MFRHRSYAATFALIIGLLTAFTHTTRAGSWSWDTPFAFGSPNNVVQACTTDPVVVNGLDSGAGSLRQAVSDACAGGSITFSTAMPPTVSLSTGQIVIDKDLSIAGPGADAMTVRNTAGAGAHNRIFQVNFGVTVAISGLTIADGALTSGRGGGILTFGHLTLAHVTVTGNFAPEYGGGIYNDHHLTIVNSTISENGGLGIGGLARRGGGIYSGSDSVAITDSTISLNNAGDGGGIYMVGGTLDITTSSIVSNVASKQIFGQTKGDGGGIYNDGATVTLTNSTVTGNLVGECLIGAQYCLPFLSTGIHDNGGSLTLLHTTITDFISHPLGGPGSFVAHNSIIAGNGTDYRLSPLGFYGGPTMTYALLTGSPAIDAGDTAASPATDQRGALRVGTPDIGAFELNNSENGGTSVAQLPDGFINTPYSFVLVPDTNGGTFTYSVTGGALPTGILLSPTGTIVVSGTTDQIGAFHFSVKGTNGTNAFVTDYSVRFLYADTPPSGGCISNPVVANRSDAGAGSLRQAVIDACPGSTITFSDAVIGKISGAEIAIDKDLTMAGPGADVLTIRNRVQVNGGVTATISRLTFSNGGIFNGGNLTLANSTVSNVYSRAGLFNSGHLTVVNSMISENGWPSVPNTSSAREGGGIHSFRGSVTITDSTVSRNFAEAGGGGIYLGSIATLTMTSSTISENRAAGNHQVSGGGLYNDGATATLVSVTVSGNSIFAGMGLGGGICNYGTLSLVNSTVANNVLVPFEVSIGGGIFNDGTVTARNSIIAWNRGERSAQYQGFVEAPDFFGELISEGYNLLQNNDLATIVGDTTGNIIGADARLAPLGDNGGPTQTHALLADSPAIDAGDTANAPPTDQRGAGRVGAADIGAYEFNGSTPTPNAAPIANDDSASVHEDAALNVAAPGILGNDTDAENDPLTATIVTNAANGSVTLNADGSFSYVPNPNFNGTDAFTYTASDGRVASNPATVTITVTAVNDPLVLSGVPASATIHELLLYSFTATASNVDGSSHTFSLVGAPSGALMHPSTGAFSWTPSEAQGPGSYSFTVHVSDGVSNAEASISVTVNEVNSAPALAPIANTTVGELTLLSVAASGSDSDDPANSLTYSLDAGFPAGMTIEPTSGAISWTPTGTQGPTDYLVTVRVTDNGSPNMSATTTFSVHVDDVNTAPVLAPVGSATIDEQVAFSFTASATDADSPAATLMFSLVGAPLGASINSSTGVFSWTPTEAQGPDSYRVTVKVTDSGSPALSDEEQITITVREVNRPPVLNAIPNQTSAWGSVFGLTAAATDPDIPAHALTFSLIGAPTTAAINSSTGAFSWTPTAEHVGSYTFAVRVTDNGSPALYDEQSVTITVGKRPTMLVNTGDGAEQYSDPQALSATLVDAGGGAMSGMPLLGRTVGFAIGTQSTSTVTTALGAGATVILTQSPSLVYRVDTIFAGDEAYLAASDSDPFDITPENARAYYTGALFASTTSAASSTATVTLSATIRDITAETDDASYDAFAGDVRNATVTFINRDTNTVIASNLPVGLVSAGDLRVGTVVYNWTVDLGNADSTDVTIGIIVGNYYTRNAAADNTLVTVSKPLGTNFITGGGSIVLENSAGTHAGASGLRSNFGLSVKYNSSGKNLQGTANVIVRAADGKVYQIKGNSMTSLSANKSNPLARTAVFNGKANIIDITDPLNPISAGGNMTLQMNMTDRGDPGSTDTIGITVWDNAGGLKFASSWNGTRTVEQALNGGNLIVR